MLGWCLLPVSLENSLNSFVPDSPPHNENFPDIELRKYLQPFICTAAVGGEKSHGKYLKRR